MPSPCRDKLGFARTGVSHEPGGSTNGFHIHSAIWVNNDKELDERGRVRGNRPTKTLGTTPKEAPVWRKPHSYKVIGRFSLYPKMFLSDKGLASSLYLILSKSTLPFSPRGEIFAWSRDSTELTTPQASADHSSKIPREMKDSIFILKELEHWGLYETREH